MWITWVIKKLVFFNLKKRPYPHCLLEFLNLFFESLVQHASCGRNHAPYDLCTGSKMCKKEPLNFEDSTTTRHSMVLFAPPWA